MYQVMKSVPLNARLVRPHRMSYHVRTGICGMEEKVGNAGEAVAEEESAAFEPCFPNSSCWSGCISTLANMMLQVSQAVQWLNLMVQLVKPGKLELHHAMKKHVLDHHHGIVDKVVRVALILNRRF